MTTLRLVNGDAEFVLYPRDDAELQGFDLGWPDIREVAEEAPDDDGTIDTTARIGARVVSVDLVLFDNPHAVLDQLRAYAHPLYRSYLVVSEDGWPGERRVLIRSGQQAVGRAAGLPALTVQLQWKAPEGFLEDVAEHVATLPAFTTTGTAGAAFPRTFPMSFPATVNASSQTFTMAGTIPVHLVARLYGPCTAPELQLVDTGERLTFPGLVLAAGEYLEVDTRSRTANVNGLADASRLTYLDFAGSTWWKLRPGVNTVRYQPASVGAGAQAVLSWRQAWI